MKNIIKKWVKGEDGATAIEYGLIMAGVALAIVAAVFAFGEDINGLFSTLAGHLDN